MDHGQPCPGELDDCFDVALLVSQWGDGRVRDRYYGPPGELLLRTHEVSCRLDLEPRVFDAPRAVLHVLARVEYGGHELVVVGHVWRQVGRDNLGPIEIHLGHRVAYEREVDEVVDSGLPLDLPVAVP